MSRRPKRRRPRGRGEGVSKAKSWAGQADTTLRTMLVNYLALPQGHTIMLGGKMYMSDEALLYVRAMIEREKQLPPGALKRALESLLPCKGVA